MDPFNPPDGFCEDQPAILGRVPVRRLSRAEYINTVRDLVYDAQFQMPEIPRDTSDSGLENASQYLTGSRLVVERYELTASAAAKAAMTDPAVRNRILTCPAWDTAEQRTACAEKFLDDFGTRALRGPLSDQERALLLSFIEAQTSQIDFEAAIELAIGVLMQSPRFNYRVETGRNGMLTPYEMASRLSYFLWQSMPDDELLAAAAAEELSTPEQLELQARRMMDDRRARDAMVDFHRQWLDLDRVMDEPKLAASFPSWSAELRDAVRSESDRFIGGLFDSELTVSTLFTSHQTEVNGPLAALYGLQPVSDWTPVQLPEQERSGILTRANFLAGHAHETNGSPILRGVFVIDRLLCAGLGAPPAEADTSLPEADPNGDPMTNRQLFEQRTSPPECAACHKMINGIGYGFEHYDAIGGYRTHDNGLAVDSTGEVLGTDVDGPFADGIELSDKLARSEALRTCMTGTWVRYSLGRRPEGADACLIQDAKGSLSESDGDIRELLVDIVRSPHFTQGLP